MRVQTSNRGNLILDRSKSPFTVLLCFLAISILAGLIAGCAGVVNGNSGGGGNQTFTLSGKLTPIAAGNGATVTISGVANASTTTDASGNYSIAGLPNGSYVVTPTHSGYSFTPASQSVTINGANLSIPTFTGSLQIYSIAGTISGAAGAILTLSGASTATTTADGSGNFSFTGLANGSYTVTPSKTGYSFMPANQPVMVNNANVTGLSFTATALTYSISGNISGVAGATVTLSGAASANTTADSSGNLSFNGLANGNYAITPSKTGYDFTPATHAATINVSNVTGVSLTAAVEAPTYTITGSISPASVGSGATVTLSGAASGNTTADANGNLSFTSLSNGTYTITPTSTTATFSSTSPNATISHANATVGFTATATANVIFYDDFTGTTLSSEWTVISRHGEYDQNETECNIPQQVSVASSLLTITTAVATATCGDFNMDGSVRHAPSSWPYITGDIQWKSLNFTYGTLPYRAKFPAKSAGLWPAVWLLGANCQNTNPRTADVGYDTCPSLNSPDSVEIDLTECDLNNWCQVALANYANAGSGGQSFPTCGYPIDTNFHTYTITWTHSAITVLLDGQPTGCNYTSPDLTIPSTPMFLIIQTQTGGAGGTPNNALLPATFEVDLVKVTQP